MNTLGHKFEFNYKIYIYNEICKCINCGIVVFVKYKNTGNIFLVPSTTSSIFYDKILDISCNEMIIKQIIE